MKQQNWCVICAFLSKIHEKHAHCWSSYGMVTLSYSKPSYTLSLVTQSRRKNDVSLQRYTGEKQSQWENSKNSLYTEMEFSWEQL